MGRYLVLLGSTLVLICMVLWGGGVMFSPDKKPYRIGVINYTPVAEPALEGLKDGLTRLGTGRDSGFEFIYAGVIPDKGALKREAERLNRVGVDLIYAMSTPASLAARQATETSRIPVVFGPVNSPVKAGIVKAMDRPGGNVTGVAFGPQESKRLEMLQKIIPGVKQIFVPYNPDDRSPVLGVKALEAGADLLGLRILARGVRSYEDFKAAVDELYGTIDAVVVPTDPFVISIVPNIAGFCIDRRLPLTTPNRESVENGALYSYGFSIREAGRQAAHLVARVLDGTPPSVIPVELADFVLTVNLDTAAVLDLNIPEQILQSAVTFSDTHN